MANILDFATWNFANVQLAPQKLKLLSAGDAVVIGGDVAVEAAARAAADAVLQGQIDVHTVQLTEISESYAHSFMLGGM